MTPTLPDTGRLPNRQRGFTLIEVVIALSIFSIGLLAASMMQSSSIKGNKSAAAISQASNWAAGKMEEIKSWPYDDARLQNNDTDNDPSTLTINPPAGSDTSPDGVYSMTWNVTANFPVTNTKTITFTVTWNVRGQTKTAQFTGIISQFM